MPVDSLIQSLEIEIKRHEEYLGFVPAFWREDHQLVETMQEQELIGSPTDGYVIIQEFLDRNSEVYNGENPISLLEERWLVEYQFIHEGWVFTKALDYEMIRKESYALENVIKKQLENKIMAMNPVNFEYFLFEMFQRLEEYGSPTKRQETRDGGYEMVVTRPHRITGNHEHILIQAKKINRKVSVSQVRELIGTLDVRSRERAYQRVSGLMISLLGETPDAKTAAIKSSFQIDFLNLGDLVNILYRHKMGWHTRELQFATLDDSFWNYWSDEDE